MTPQEAETLQRLLRDSLESSLRPGERFRLEGEWAEGHLCLLVELSSPARDQVLRLESALALEKPADESIAQARGTLVEFLHAWLRAWLENERFPSPDLEWGTHAFNGHDILLRGTFRNEKLESLADQWLEAAERGEVPPNVEDV